MATLRAVLVTPLSGPLAGYGRTGVRALRLWADRAARLPPRFSVVALDVYDAHPDPSRAVRAAAATSPHALFGPYGSGPSVAVAKATTRLVWNHGGATSRLALPAFSRVISVLSPAASYFEGALRAVRAADPGARTVSILHAASGFGADVAEGAISAARGLGFEIAPVVFPAGEAGTAARRVPEADVLLVAGGFDDEMTAASALLDRPWRAAGFVGAGVEEVLAPLGPAREGLLGPAQWMAGAAPKPDEGPDADWFVDAYRRDSGADPSYPAAQAFAAGLILARCLRQAGEPSDDALLAAARDTRCTTLYGSFRLDPATGRQVGHEMLTVQWQDGVRRVVWPPARAECPVVLPLRP